MIGTHVPNERWSYKDSAGHGHHFDAGKLPSLEIVLTGTSWCDECGQSHESYVFVCKKCRERVEPEFRYLPAHEVPKKEAQSFVSKLMSTPIIRGITGAAGATGPVMIPSSPGPITSVGLRREMEEIEVTSFGGARTHLPHPLWILEINGMDVPITDMEAEVFRETGGNREAVLEFAQQICGSRGITITSYP